MKTMEPMRKAYSDTPVLRIEIFCAKCSSYEAEYVIRNI